MEQQSYELIKGMKSKANVHVIKPDPNKSIVWFYIFLIWKINAYLKNHPEIEIIHANDGIIALLCSFINNKSRYQMTCTLHGLDVTWPNAIYQKHLLKRLFTFDKIITVSEATKKECIKRGFPPKILVAIPNGVDHKISLIDIDHHFVENLIEELHLDEDKKIIVSIGRPVIRKGFSWFINNVLSKLDPDTIYLMVGDLKKKDTWFDWLLRLLPAKWSHQLSLSIGYADDCKSIRNALNEKQFKNRVFHLGKLPFQQMLSVLSIADIMVMPNLSRHGDFEGFGLVSLEANLRSKFVLASKIEGIQDAIHDGQNGLLIESANASSWIKTLQRLFEHPNILDAKGRYAEDFVKDTFSWSTMTNQYFHEFKQLQSKVTPIPHIQYDMSY
jgi:glycosyltransferase involved in cell wall biosynthesis